MSPGTPNIALSLKAFMACQGAVQGPDVGCVAVALNDRMWRMRNTAGSPQTDLALPLCGWLAPRQLAQELALTHSSTITDQKISRGLGRADQV
jgi:hypothetical protein